MLRMKPKWMIVVLCTIVMTCGSFGQVLAVEEEEEEEAVEMKAVIVTATRVPTEEREVGSSVTVITEEEIKAKGYTTAKDVLKGTVGLDVVSTGGPGAQTSVFSRGANAYHTLVLIDGMEMGDPSQTQRQFDFANLTVDNIERIEIVRGPQSVLYGADAMGGVVNIITKGWKKEPTLYGGAEGGSYGTARQFVGLGTANEWADFSFDFSHIRSEGFSAADSDLPGNTERDAWENYTVSSRLGITPTEWLDMGVNFRFHNGRTELDNQGGPYQDLEDYSLDKQEFFIRPHARVTLFNGLWEQVLAYGLTNHSKDYHYPSLWGGGSGDYDGEKQEISWQHNLYLHKTNTLTLGFEYETEEMHTSDWGSDQDDSAYTYSLFAQDQIKLFDISFTTLGIRWDNHEAFGDHITYRVTQAFVFDKIGTTIKGSVGTGFRAPSLYELYGPPYLDWSTFPPAPTLRPVGNHDLDPEESIGWDVGVEQALFNDLLTLGATYFHNEFDDLIEFVNGQGYVNIDEAETYGVESFIEVRPFKDLSARVMYTYTHTDDDEGEPLLRRPLHKAGLNVCYRFLDERGTVNLDLLYVGERDDKDFTVTPARRLKLDDYVVVNLSGSFKVHKYVELFARIENLFDQDYEEAFGYGTPGFSVYGGVKLSVF
jgi:vitamin B12 transporter